MVALNAPAQVSTWQEKRAATEEKVSTEKSARRTTKQAGGFEPTSVIEFELALGNDRGLPDRILADRSLTDRGLADHGGRRGRLTNRKISSGSSTHESESRSRNEKKLFHDCALVLDNDPYLHGQNHAYKKRRWLIKLVLKRHSELFSK